jgi:UDP-glucose 4-epimerase
MDIHGKYTEVLIRWLEKIAAGEHPVIYGDGLQTMDLVYIDDVTDANITAMESDVTDEVFNVATGKETSLLDLLQALLRVTGSTLTPQFMPARSVNPVPRRLADTGKAENLLGFRAKVGIDEGLRRLIDWRESVLIQKQA